MKISVVIPSYRCAACLEELHRRLVVSLEKITSDFEILFVNDASPENDWEIITKLAGEDKRVIGINLSRNFGQHNAITAGLDHVTGDWTVVMDGDLQDQPEEIIKLYNKAMEGYDVVFGRRYQRKDGFFKKFFAYFFRYIFNYFVSIKIDPSVSNFSICKKNVIQSFRRFKEKDRAFQILILWLGFKISFIDIEHQKRTIGKTSYSFFRLTDLAIDLIISHSNKPLKLSIKFGFFMSIISLLYGLYLIYNKIYYGISIEGWTSIIVSLYFIGGLLFANLGLIGLYIGKIYNAVKDRPLYIIRDIKNIEEKGEK